MTLQRAPEEEKSKEQTVLKCQLRQGKARTTERKCPELKEGKNRTKGKCKVQRREEKKVTQT